MNTLLRFGLLAGGLLCLPMFGPYLLFGLRPEWMKAGEIIGYSSMVLCMSATYFAMRREQGRRGPLGYASLLTIGVGVSAVAGLVFGLATWIFYSAVGDALPEALLDFYLMQANDPALAPAESARRVAEIESMKPLFFNRPLQAAVMFATVFVIGVAMSLAAAWLAGRRTSANLQETAQ
jgi:multisubunit Na+/H+ antiporter MnhB subunit